MIKRKENMNVETKTNMRGGDKEVKLMHIHTQDELKGNCRLFSKITLEVGSSIGLHTHINEEEVYYILSGTGTITDNQSSYEVFQGDSVLTGHNMSHSIKNTGNENLEFLAVILTY